MTKTLTAETILAQFAGQRADLISMQAHKNDTVLWFDKAGLSWHRPTADMPHGWACGVQFASIFQRGCRMPVITNGAGERARAIPLELAITKQLAALDAAIAAVTQAQKEA